MTRLLLILTISIGVSTPVLAQSAILQPLAGKNLQKISRDKLASLRKLLADKGVESRHDIFFSPWHVWATSRSLPERFLVFEGQPLYTIPGASSARIHAFDASNRKLKQWDFSTGWRIDLNHASMSYSDDLAAHLITIESSREINGRDVAKQYFTFTKDRLRFLRMEDSKGHILSNNYEYPNHTLGVVPEAKSHEDWAELLSSNSRSDVLSALTFLGGRHLDLRRREPVYVENIEQARMVKELRIDKSIGKLVRLQAKSDFKWIAEAAGLAEKTLTKQ